MTEYYCLQIVYQESTDTIELSHIYFTRPLSLIYILTKLHRWTHQHLHPLCILANIDGSASQPMC